MKTITALLYHAAILALLTPVALYAQTDGTDAPPTDGASDYTIIMLDTPPNGGVSTQAQSTANTSSSIDGGELANLEVRLTDFNPNGCHYQWQAQSGSTIYTLELWRGSTLLRKINTTDTAATLSLTWGAMPTNTRIRAHITAYSGQYVLASGSLEAKFLQNPAADYRYNNAAPNLPNTTLENIYPHHKKNIRMANTNNGAGGSGGGCMYARDSSSNSLVMYKRYELACYNDTLSRAAFRTCLAKTPKYVSFQQYFPTCINTGGSSGGGSSINERTTSRSSIHRVSPNPFHENLDVSLLPTSDGSPTVVVMYRLADGSEVFRQTVSTDRATFHTEALAQGVYLVVVPTNTGTEAVKVVKE